MFFLRPKSKKLITRKCVLFTVMIDEAEGKFKKQRGKFPIEEKWLPMTSS